MDKEYYVLCTRNTPGASAKAHEDTSRQRLGGNRVGGKGQLKRVIEPTNTGLAAAAARKLSMPPTTAPSPRFTMKPVETTSG